MPFRKPRAIEWGIVTRATLDKRPEDVAAMFDRTAERYDLLNDLMTAGQDRVWRREVVKTVDARPGELILDLAAGTGTSTVPFAEAGANAVACDFSLGMLKVGVDRLRSVRGMGFVAGDALKLPFADDRFDAVTISFGIRNVADTVAALAELRRVTRPDGRLVVCESSRPVNPLVRRLHGRYLRTGLPLLARFSSNPDSYNYLGESMAAWHDQATMARLMQEAGWTSVRWRNLSFGAVALHYATA
jgi:demethylmenaquinone methyltransferase / 2-methoxy-6-polyprenyl-1,4-benzoquinol methylase